MYVIEANMPWQSEFTFDPTVVIRKLAEQFCELTYCLDDRAWSDFDYFHSRGVLLGALWTDEEQRDPNDVSPSRHRVRHIAANDARRRGPIWLFRVIWHDGAVYHGKVEREFITLWSEQPFPDELRQRFVRSLQQLEFVPPEVSAYRLEGNDREVLPEPADNRGE